VNKKSAVNEPRSYRSPGRERRAQETRARIVSAAESLFVTDGYSATTIRAIARKAAVAEQTVYLIFKNKPALLDAAIDAALGGPSGTAWRTELEDALTRPPEQLLRAFAQATARVMERTAPILAAAEAAATVEPELRDSRERGHRQMRKRFQQVADTLQDLKALAGSSEHATATIYALTSEAVYLRLTNGHAWDSETYGQWLGDLLVATLLRT
jgi:TetR/AcrR family transcriptional regulator, regulator of cefoperazone and chloramphenicol sensitivity